MRSIFYRILIGCTRVFGTWFFSLVAGGIATGYFLIFPRRVGVGLRFYQTLFPERGRLYHGWCTFRQFVNFTHVFRDRLVMNEEGALTHEFDGWERLRDAMQASGGILIMSHMGNWEVAARLLKKTLPDLRLMLLMGVKQKEQIENIQKQAVRQSDILIKGVDESGGSPLDIVEAVRFLKDGGLVSLTGDRIWQEDQRTLSVRFLDHEIRLPAAPYALALATGAPLFVFFALRTSSRHYHFSASQPIVVQAADRSRREAAMQQAAQQYATLLEDAVRGYPFQWQHFEPFLDRGRSLAV